MRTVFLTGSHPRHLHIAKRLYEEGLLHGLLIETRENFTPSPSPHLADIDRTNYIRHFTDREIAETRAFGSVDISFFKDIPLHETTMEKLNSAETGSWLKTLQADTVVSYGIHKLEKDILEILPERAWNIHGGLSPWYRGNITLFWPFYFLKPNWSGMTIHRLSAKLDGGDIIHHSTPVLNRGDGVHDVACNAVRQSGEDLIRLLNLIKEGRQITPVPQKSNGKLFTSTDWMPQHLRLIYNTFNNDIVDRFLDGEFGSDEPPLVKAF